MTRRSFLRGAPVPVQPGCPVVTGAYPCCTLHPRVPAHPRFKISASPGGQFTFNLTAANAEIILTSGRYTSKDVAKNGIASVKTNAPNDQRYEDRVAVNGQYYFVLRAGNKEVIGTSEMYAATAVKTNAPIAPIEE